MSDRKNYRKYTLEEFTTELAEEIITFVENMNELGIDNISFPEWYETFGAWLEVGSSMEEMSYS